MYQLWLGRNWIRERIVMVWKPSNVRPILRWPPVKPAIWFSARLVTARHEEGCYENSIFMYCLVCRGLWNDDVGMARGATFQDIPPGGGVKTGDFVKEKLGGAAVERLVTIQGEPNPTHRPSKWLRITFSYVPFFILFSDFFFFVGWLALGCMAVVGFNTSFSLFFQSNRGWKSQTP